MNSNDDLFLKIVHIAKKQHKNNVRRLFFNMWKDDHYNKKQKDLQKEHEENLNRELSELSAKYNKEIDTFSTKLNETNKLLEEATKNKIDIQENLKKAFMRGVCALNFEAMSILQPTTQASIDQNALERLMASTSNISNKVADLGINMRDITSSALANPTEEATGTFQNFYDNTSLIPNLIPEKVLSQQNVGGGDRDRSPKKNVIFYQPPRVFIDL